MRSIWRRVQTLALICLAFGLSACVKNYSLDGWDEFSSAPIPIVCGGERLGPDEVLKRAEHATIAYMKQDDYDYWQHHWDYLDYDRPIDKYHTVLDTTLVALAYGYTQRGMGIWGDGGIMILFDPCTSEVHDLNHWMVVADPVE